VEVAAYDDQVEAVRGKAARFKVDLECSYAQTPRGGGLPQAGERHGRKVPCVGIQAGFGQQQRVGTEPRGEVERFARGR